MIFFGPKILVFAGAVGIFPAVGGIIRLGDYQLTLIGESIRAVKNFGHNRRTEVR